MHALLLAHARGERLAPLTDSTPLAMLPVANKPLLQHALESLALAGLRDVTITVPAGDATIERFVAGGRRWGLSARIVEFGAVIDLAGDTIVLACDAVRSPRLVADVLRHSADSAAPVLRSGVDAQDATVWFLRAGRRLAACDVDALPRTAANAVPVPVEGSRQYRVDDLASYHAANMAAVAGDVPGLFLDGRAAGGRRRVGSRARVAAASLVGDRALVGARAWVERSVRIGDGAVVGDDVCIDAEASLYATVVLPNTYIGSSVSLRNAIVRGNLLIRIDTGIVTEVTDPFLLDTLRSSRGSGRRVLSWFRSAA